jgi:hypothetical protein
MGAGYSPSPIRTTTELTDEFRQDEIYRRGGAGAIAIADGSYARSRRLLRGDVCRVLYFRPESNSEFGGRNREVQFTPESRLNLDIAACPFGTHELGNAEEG